MKKIILKGTATILILFLVFLSVVMFFGMPLGNSGDEIKNGVWWDTKMLAPTGRPMPTNVLHAYVSAIAYHIYANSLFFTMMMFVGILTYFNFRMLGWKPKGIVPGSMVIFATLCLLFGLALGISEQYSISAGLKITQMMFVMMAPVLAFSLFLNEWIEKEEGVIN